MRLLPVPQNWTELSWTEVKFSRKHLRIARGFYGKELEWFASGLWPRNFAEGNDVLSLKWRWLDVIHVRLRKSGRTAFCFVYSGGCMECFYTERVFSLQNENMCWKIITDLIFSCTVSMDRCLKRCSSYFAPTTLSFRLLVITHTYS